MNKKNQGLYETQFEHDNCGIGAVVNIKGKQSHKIVDDALKIVEKLEHRAGKDAEGKTGDGVGIMLQISHSFFKKAAAPSLSLPAWYSSLKFVCATVLFKLCFYNID